MAGSLDGFEEAARALFAADRERFDALIAPLAARHTSAFAARGSIGLDTVRKVDPCGVTPCVKSFVLVRQPCRSS